MKLPAYYITPEMIKGAPVSGVTFNTIPIPNNSFVIDYTSDNITLLESDVLVFVIYKDNDDLYPIGLLAHLVSKIDLQDTILATYTITGRVLIESLVNDQVSAELLIEEFSPDEENLIDEIKIRTATLPESLIDPHVLRSIKDNPYLFAKMDILANAIINNQQTRIAYLQANNNSARWALVQKALSELTRVNTTKSLPLEQKIKSLLPLFSEDIQEELKQEVGRLSKINKSSHEYSMLLDYLSWITNLPWEHHPRKQLDLLALKNKLDSTHYSLQDVKDYLIEYFCAEQRAIAPTGTVLCFAGPPGTGKTSLAKEIASASNRPLIKIALGGITDEAELRGHRRTYISSRPGRIVTSLKRAGCLDPIIILDEIDKISTIKGDPIGALLEILDPEQNNAFLDRYLEIPVDLSRVLFICTANDLNQISKPLLDRLDIVHFSSYSPEELERIIVDYLIPKIKRNYDLADSPISITQNIISKLSQECSVREAFHQLQRLYRKAATAVYVYNSSNYLIDTLKFNNSKRMIGFTNEN